ncbi:MAG: DUF1254 domain-containing protein [Sandarakinorhabdus sp.]|nr:DUF1254 domain-containing protein [Sandarakinorhabdus sp.]
MRYLKFFVTAWLVGTSVTATAAPARTAATARGPAATATASVLAPLPNTPEIAELRRAFRFAFPIYEILRTRGFQLDRARAAGIPNAVNFILPRLTLADAGSREVTTPNNDTLYGSAWLDLAAGPIILEVPALPGRYNSVALMSLTTDNTAILGTRTGGQGGRYAIVGPNFSGAAPAGTELVRSATNDAWLLIRVLVDGPGDVGAAAKALQGFTITSAEGNVAVVPTMPAPANPDGKTFLAVVNEALARSAANTTLAGKASQFAAGGIGAATTPETAAMWSKYLPALRAELKGGLASIGDTVQGWSYPGAGIGDYGDDDDMRSKVALGGLAALPRVEAMYLTAKADKNGAPLDGAKPWRVILPPNLPVGAFWSLTMYEQDADGRLFFVPNVLNRYAVGNRSPQLRSNRDGSYEIFIQPTKPSGERVVNWLPSPTKGKFTLVFRAYLPRAPLLDGSFRLPPVEAGELIE